MFTINSLASQSAGFAPDRQSKSLPRAALFASEISAQTYASWPVWSGSARDSVKFTPLPKKQAIRLYHQARQWNRTRCAKRYGGMIGSAAMRVLESLIFDFLNFASGRLDPGYAALARRTGLSRATVATALQRLKTLGIVCWLRRCCKDQDADGRFMLRQRTNAYAVLPPSQWRGFSAPPEAPPPDPSAWGAEPPVPRLSERIATARRDGCDPGFILTLLEQEADDPLAATLARLGRALHKA